MKAQIGANVRLARRAKGWTQSELAEASGMSQAGIGRIELGNHPLGIDVIIDLAEALDVAVYDLLDQ